MDSVLLSTVPPTTQTYNTVIAAEYKVDRTEDRDGNTERDHYVVLITEEREIPVFQDSIYIGDVGVRPIDRSEDPFRQDDRLRKLP